MNLLELYCHVDEFVKAFLPEWNKHLGIAEIGKTTKGWFYGFKLHLICNHRGELISCHITPGNVDDRSPVSKMTRNLLGKLFGDKGYISKKLFDELFSRGLQLITGIKENMNMIR